MAARGLPRRTGTKDLKVVKPHRRTHGESDVVSDRVVVFRNGGRGEAVALFRDRRRTARIEAVVKDRRAAQRLIDDAQPAPFENLHVTTHAREWIAWGKFCAVVGVVFYVTEFITRYGR